MKGADQADCPKSGVLTGQDDCLIPLRSQTDLFLLAVWIG